MERVVKITNGPKVTLVFFGKRYLCVAVCLRTLVGSFSCELLKQRGDCANEMSACKRETYRKIDILDASQGSIEAL